MPCGEPSRRRLHIPNKWFPDGTLRCEYVLGWYGEQRQSSLQPFFPNDLCESSASSGGWGYSPEPHPRCRLWLCFPSWRWRRVRRWRCGCGNQIWKNRHREFCFYGWPCRGTTIRLDEKFRRLPNSCLYSERLQEWLRGCCLGILRPHTGIRAGLRFCTNSRRILKLFQRIVFPKRDKPNLHSILISVVLF